MSSALVENVMHFARILRGAGLPIGPGRVIDGVRAVETAGIETRGDLYWALHAVFVNRRDQHQIFHEAFNLFWRDPKLVERLMAPLLSQTEAPREEKPAAGSRRLMDAIQQDKPHEQRPREEQEQVDFAMTWSDREVLQAKDFEQMSAAELAAAKRALAAMRFSREEIPTRRFAPAHAGTRLDLKATLKASARRDHFIELKWREARTRRPPLVVLCDVSGSMERYSRMFLHFLHALTNDRDRVFTFLFGTRLTPITRALKQRDPDAALARVAQAVPDWAGGTRIGGCLAEFNRRWARRVLGQGATVLLITDGLDREGAAGVAREMDRLAKSCRRLVWLNPLLRYAGFEPKSLGARAILPYVDEFRPAHNLESLGDIAAALVKPPVERRSAGRAWRVEEKAA